jgi:hypothetical protein
MAGAEGIEPPLTVLDPALREGLDGDRFAGPRGIEPLLRVLETPGLPLTYGPIFNLLIKP